MALDRLTRFTPRSSPALQRCPAREAAGSTHHVQLGALGDGQGLRHDRGHAAGCHRHGDPGGAPRGDWRRRCRRAAAVNLPRGSDFRAHRCPHARPQALDKFTIEKDVAAYIKKEFDSKHGPTWHCIVGRNFGACTHSRGGGRAA